MHSALTFRILHSEFRPLCPLSVPVYTLQLANLSPSLSNPKSQITNPKSKDPQPATRNPQLVTRTPQLVTRNSQLATRNSQPAPRNPNIILHVAKCQETKTSLDYQRVNWYLNRFYFQRRQRKDSIPPIESEKNKYKIVVDDHRVSGYYSAAGVVFVGSL